MSIVAVLIETTDNKVKEASFGVLTAAHCGGENEVYGFVTDADPQVYQEDLAKYGVSKIVSIQADGADLSSKPDLQATSIIAGLKEYNVTTLLGLSSSTGKDIMARIAAQLGAPLALDCFSVDLQARTVRKPFFAGKTIATLRQTGEYFLCAIRANAIEPVEAQSESETVVFTVAVNGDDGIVIKETKKADSGKVNLTEANVIVSGG